jgi:hypothetical protein
LSAVSDFLFNIFAATRRICRRFPHPQPEEAPCRGDGPPSRAFSGIPPAEFRHGRPAVPHDVFLTRVQPLASHFAFFGPPSSASKHASLEVLSNLLSPSYHVAQFATYCAAVDGGEDGIAPPCRNSSSLARITNKHVFNVSQKLCWVGRWCCNDWPPSYFKPQKKVTVLIFSS